VITNDLNLRMSIGEVVRLAQTSTDGEVVKLLPRGATDVVAS
jgi:hypothetical protein